MANDPSMEHRVTWLEATLSEHVKLCDRRAAVAQKLLWFVAATVATVLGILLKSQFNIGG